MEDTLSLFDFCSPSNKQESQRTEKNVQDVKRPASKNEDDDDSDDEETTKPSKKIKKSDDLEDLNPEDYSERIQIHVVDTIEACLHEVAVPPSVEYRPLEPAVGAPAKEYKFILDPFQKEAILCLENKQSVLVSAHTSAGKTVVAEYAIAMSLRDKQRVVYTTPIKALSNQKYREFSTEFKDVGLITGDVTINASASILIMTTEILRSMLYQGSEIMREVGWVVFDEIHYMRDKERGVVWEETIILLPDTIHYVFLSATIPNATQFAEWICHLHNQPCHVVYTDYRPVPLQQFIFPAGADGIYLVVDEKGTFLDDNFGSAMDALKLGVGDQKQRGRRGGFKGNESNCFKVVKMIMELNYAPVIVFSFSKKECEAYAVQMSKLDFNNNEEKTMVDTVFWNAMDVLSAEDKKLPQVENVLPLLKRGIGIHHSGLLPILKETIEILFGEGLIKALFATETFAMGLNMPARTVLFTNARKFDGKDFRWITSGEYIQMSGRAGRRGQDSSGIVILMVDEKINPSEAKTIVKGLPDPINSAFHLTYNMVLNLLRVEDINPEFMLGRSFFQFQNYSSIPQLVEELRNLKVEHDAMVIKNEDDVSSYYNICKKLESLNQEMKSLLIQPKYAIGFLRPGRLARVKSTAGDFGWGLVINYHKKASKMGEPTPGDTAENYVVDILIHVSKESAETTISANVTPPKPGEIGEMKVVPILLPLIQEISAVCIHFPEDLRLLDSRMKVLKIIQGAQRKFPEGMPELDPEVDMRITDEKILSTFKMKKAYQSRLISHPLKKNPDFKAIIELYEKKTILEAKMKEVKTELKKAHSLIKMEELKCRKRVLRRMGFCTASDTIEIKGRVACEINSADELVLTEMIFNGVFNNLNTHQISSLLSCFVFQEKTNEMPKLTEELSGPLRLMQDIARRIAKVSKECRLEISENYVESFRPHLMDVVHAWSKGASFADICKMTDVFEGSIIRCFRRLEELMRQMCQAAKAIGNTELENKFSEAIKCIKREIAFAASLYL